MLEETAVHNEVFNIIILEKKTKITIILSRETYLILELVLYSTSLSIEHVLTLFQSLSNYSLLHTVHFNIIISFLLCFCMNTLVYISHISH